MVIGHHPCTLRHNPLQVLQQPWKGPCVIIIALSESAKLSSVLSPHFLSVMAGEALRLSQPRFPHYKMRITSPALPAIKRRGPKSSFIPSNQHLLSTYYIPGHGDKAREKSTKGFSGKQDSSLPPWSFQCKGEERH